MIIGFIVANQYQIKNPCRMSDLSHVFRQSKIKQSTPSKKLFEDERSRHRPKEKPILKASTTSTANSPNFPIQQLAKRYLSKQNLKKQLSTYNSQVLLSLLRKVFFIMVTSIVFNICATGTDQRIVCCNLALGLALLDLHVGWDFLGLWWFRTLHLLVRFSVYCLNFAAIYTMMLESYNRGTSLHAEVVVAVNAGINYMLFMLLRPMVTLRTIHNRKTPYMSLTEFVSAEIGRYVTSLKTCYYLFRPILFLNVCYTLLVVMWIMRHQDATLFQELFSFACFRGYIATTLLLHILFFVLEVIDRNITIELLGNNKKEINLNLLRLDEANSNNCDVLREIERYIWRNNENFWDMDFLAHRYNINYDLIENHILKTLSKLQQSTDELKIAQFSNYVKTSQRESTSLPWLLQVYKIISAYEQKKYLFFMIEQIVMFQKMGTCVSIHMDAVIKATMKLTKALGELQEVVGIREIKRSLGCLLSYLEHIVNQYK